MSETLKKFTIQMSELVKYEVEVEAMDEEEAIDVATDKLIGDYNGIYVVDQTGFQLDRVDETKGGTEDGR